MEKKELAPLSDAQVKDFLCEASNDDLEIVMKVILFTGLRESEAAPETKAGGRRYTGTSQKQQSPRHSLWGHWTGNTANRPHSA